MKKGSLITILTLIIIAVICISCVAVVKLVGKKIDNDVSGIVPTENTDNGTEMTSELEKNSGTDDGQTDVTTVEKKEEAPTVNVSEPKTETPKTEESKTEEPKTEETKTEEPKTADVQYNTTMPSSYKDFALTKGMTASEAYNYLNDFLNSKYSILVNKQNKVGSDYAPTNLVTVSGSDYRMEQTAATALEKLLKAGKNAGITDLVLYSAYRTYASQKNKFDTRTQKYLDSGLSQSEAEEKAGEYIAPPGSSEHHTGLAADVCSSAIVTKYGCLEDNFDQTKEYRWLSENAPNYGFILRYKNGREDTTGFLYEPWHYRYIGVDHAKACTALGVTYEEYHALLEKLRTEAKNEMNA